MILSPAFSTPAASLLHQSFPYHASGPCLHEQWGENRLWSDRSDLTHQGSLTNSDLHSFGAPGLAKLLHEMVLRKVPRTQPQRQARS